jgi:serine/threonine-protein kinase
VIGADVGQQFGEYRIEEFIGRGGMGIVYRAEHMHLGRKVALKLLAPELAENESFRERFVRESRLAASIDHPNVIPIYEAGEAEGHYFIAMRYVDGVDLKEVIRTSGPLTVPRALYFTQQMAGALDAAHAKDLVHRDVKPGNVLVAAGTDHCYLTDFGLTKAMSSNTGFTATGQFVGTTDYCAPEQIEGKPLDRRTDVYSLACVFYECLTGQPPFHRDTDMATMWAHIQEPPPAITHARPDLPASLDTVLATAMAKRKEDRYPTCSSFWAATMAALETGTGVSYAGSATQPDHAPPTAPLVTGSATQPDQAPPLPAPPYAHPGVPPAYPPAPPQPGWAPGPYDSQPTSVQRHKPVTAIAVIVAALLVAGGGTAAALIITKDKDSNSQTAAQPAQPATPDSIATPPPETTPRESTPPTDEVSPPPEDPEPTPPPEPAVDDEAAVEAAAEGHWDAIDAGDYGTAFDYFSASNPQNRGRWIDSHESDQIRSAKGDWTTRSVSGNSAIADVVSLRTKSRNGCQDWTGWYDMVKEGGEWKIADSHLSDSPCG